MDKVISNWTMEFLIQSFVPDSLIQKTLTVLPNSTADSRLKIALLLRTLQTTLLNASLSETSLEILEHLENLYHNDAIPIFDAMRSAYCAVAVESTVKYLVACPEAPSGEYYSAVRRIWHQRVHKLSEEGRRRRSELLSDELDQWRQDVEAALWNVRVSERLVGLNTRRDAMNQMNRFLKEAWETIGLSYIDSMETVSIGNALRHERVCEIASGSVVSNKCEGKLEGLRKEKMNSVGHDENENENVNNNENENEENDNVNGDVATMRENHGNEQLEERVGTYCDANQEVGGCDSSKGDKEIRKDNHQLKRKHSAIQTYHTGVRISDAEEASEEAKTTNLSFKFENLPSAEVEKVWESLRSSSIEVKAMVKDPLPDALHASEIVRSKLAAKDINRRPPVENQSGHVDAPDSTECKTIVLYQPNDINLGKKSSVHCSSSSRRLLPKLMERGSSAHTFEWDDSIENKPHVKQPKKKKRRWTSLEEDTLRDGVKMFGEGNWRDIREFYRKIFEFRSAGDLKDKWRNLIR
ncbi:unnamed protein product [Trifolium pratense]|uniref:Uncharacterized protein n=1 Tax=Trifolium pratense TaxID=57577 RepID=A0ACB0IGI0_TRIPR|nr:unnamed protein product [Trifolium pratense]